MAGRDRTAAHLGDAADAVPLTAEFARAAGQISALVTPDTILRWHRPAWLLHRVVSPVLAAPFQPAGTTTGTLVVAGKATLSTSDQSAVTDLADDLHQVVRHPR